MIEENKKPQSFENLRFLTRKIKILVHERYQLSIQAANEIPSLPPSGG